MIKKTYKTAIIIIATSLIIQGCSIHSTREDQDKSNHNLSDNIDTYSITIETQKYKSPNKSFNKKIKNITSSTLNATGIDKESINPSDFHLEINVLETNAHGNGWELFTGLSFGLIPYWSDIEDVYIYDFTILHKNTAIYHKTYFIDRLEFAHLILIPAGIATINNNYYQPAYDSYQNALNNTIKQLGPE